MLFNFHHLQILELVHPKALLLTINSNNKRNIYFKLQIKNITFLKLLKCYILFILI
jgi:hypothetical protein